MNLNWFNLPLQIGLGIALSQIFVRILRLIGLASVVFAMVACTSIPANPSGMTPEQLREWVKDKNANVGCAVVNSPYGRGVGVYVVLDRGIVIDGTVVVDDQCKVTISNSRPK